MDLTLGPTPTAVAQDSRRPIEAVAGMTIPAVERRSPSAPSSLTSTRSCSIRIGSPASVRVSALTTQTVPRTLRAQAAVRGASAGVAPRTGGKSVRPATTVDTARRRQGGWRLSRLQRVRQNLRRAYDTGRESVREARADSVNGSEGDHEVEFEPPPPGPPVDHQSTASHDDTEVPHSLRIGAAWSWRLIVVGLLGWVLLRIIGTISIVV